MHILSSFFIVTIFLNIQQQLFGMSNDVKLALNILKMEIIKDYAVIKLKQLKNFANENEIKYKSSKDLIEKIASDTQKQPDNIVQSLVNEANCNALEDIGLFNEEIDQYQNMTINNITPEFIEKMVSFFNNNTEILLERYISVDFIPCLQLLKSKIDSKNEHVHNNISSLVQSLKKRNKSNFSKCYKIGLFSIIIICSICLCYGLLSQKLGS